METQNKSNNSNVNRRINPRLMSVCAVNRLITLACSFSALVSLMEAHFWVYFYSEYKSRRILSTTVFITSVCGPGLLLCIPVVRKLQKLPFRVKTLILVLISLLLFITSLPSLDKKPEVRMILLSLSVFLAQLLIVLFWSCQESGVTGELYLAVFITMVIKLTSSGINLFCENVYFMLTVFILNFLLSCVACLQNSHNKRDKTSYRVEQESNTNDEHKVNIELLEVNQTEVNQGSTPEINGKVNNNHLSLALIVSALGIAAGLSLFTQFFTSPYTFVRLAGYEDEKYEFLIIFACLISCFVCAFELNHGKPSRKPQNTDKLKEVSFLTLRGSLIFSNCLKLK